MIEMICFLMRSSVTAFRYDSSKDFFVLLKKGTAKYLRDGDNRSLRYYFKDEIGYV